MAPHSSPALEPARALTPLPGLALCVSCGAWPCRVLRRFRGRGRGILCARTGTVQCIVGVGLGWQRSHFESGTPVMVKARLSANCCKGVNGTSGSSLAVW